VHVVDARNRRPVLVHLGPRRWERSAFARVKKLSAALASPKTKDAVPASANASASDGLNEILRIAERSSTAPAGSDITGGT
jgi:hypothetical protein